MAGGAAVCRAIAFCSRRAVVISTASLFAMAWLVLVLSVGAIFLLMILIRDGGNVEEWAPCSIWFRR